MKAKPVDRIKIKSPGNQLRIPKNATLEDMVRFAHSIGCELTVELVPYRPKRRKKK